MTNLQILKDDLTPSNQLAESCISYINEINEIIDGRLPAIKVALQNNLTITDSDVRFTAEMKAEIQVAINRL